MRFACREDGLFQGESVGLLMCICVKTCVIVGKSACTSIYSLPCKATLLCNGITYTTTSSIICVLHIHEGMT